MHSKVDGTPENHLASSLAYDEVSMDVSCGGYHIRLALRRPGALINQQVSVVIEKKMPESLR